MALDRAMTMLAAAWGTVLAGGDPSEPLSLARMALAVEDDHPAAATCAAAREALDAALPELNGLAGLAIAACLLVTPSVPAA